MAIVTPTQSSNQDALSRQVESFSILCDLVGSICMSYFINAADELFSCVAGSLDRRVSRGFKALFHLVLYAIPAVLGAVVYMVGRVTKGGSCYYIRGKGEKQVIREPTVASHNIARLWGAEKFDKLQARAMRPFEEYACDLLFVQEAFGMEAYRFARIVRRQFAHMFLRPGGCFAGLDPGLAVFSKVPILSCQFFPFKNRGRDFVQHGFMIVETEHHVFVNAHLDAIEDSALHIRQFKEIEEKVALLEKPVYVCGDLNLCGVEDRAYIQAKLRGKIEGIDALHGWHRTSTEVTLKEKECETSDHPALIGQIGTR